MSGFQTEEDPSVNFSNTAGDDDSSEDGEGLVVDLANTGEGGFVALPRGIYACTVAQLDYGKSQRSGNWMWTWQFEVEDGEAKGRKLFYHTVFNEGGMPRVKRTLSRIKAEGGFEQSLLSGPFNPKTVAEEGRLLGARCRVRVDIRNYEGQKRNDVKDVLAPMADAGGGFAS